jgi:hypothetical protein
VWGEAKNRREKPIKIGHPYAIKKDQSKIELFK